MGGIVVREIRFRGRRVDDGEWVYGDLIHYRPKTYKIMEQDFGLWDVLEGADDVDPATVGQLTGLRDKNGAEIYEGDIVYYHPEANVGKGLVEFLGGCFCVTGEDFLSCLDNFATAGIEVIGNKWEDSELLQGEL